MNSRLVRLMTVALATVTLAGAQDKAAVPSDAKPLIDAMASIGALIAGADKPAENAAVEKDAAATPEGSAQEPATAGKGRTAKASVILVTSGAAAGAAVGAAMGKGSKGAMIGAAVGGAVGLIYDRMTYKNPGAI